MLAALAASAAGAAPPARGARGGHALRPFTVASTRAPDPNTPVLISNPNKPPAGYRLTAAQVESIAAFDPLVVDELRRHRGARPYEYTKGPGRWQVSWFTQGRHQDEIIQVYVDDASGRVTEAWTGYQVAWTMARGYPGAFGRRSNALYVWLPLCALFFLAFVPRPRRWRRGGGGWSLLHVDLAVLLAFGRGLPRRPLPLLVGPSWLAVGLIFLVGFRVGLNIADSNVIDVGYAGVIGAQKLVHGQPLYGGWPADNAAGDTYGPVDYLTYVPFYAAFGWSGVWDSLPAAHAAAIAFDLLTMLCLFLLGRSIRGPTLGVVLAYAWAAYPFTLFALSSNSNDALVALMVVLALLVLRSAPARGAVAALAGLAKFAPLALGPLLLRGADRRPRGRSLAAFIAVYGATAVVVMLPVVLGHDLAPFWHDTVVYQVNRPAPFSVWGLWGGLSLEQHLAQAAVVVLAAGAAFLPRRRSWLTVASLAAAILIALQLTLTYWFYLYIPWFLAPLLVALLGSHPREGPSPPPAGELAPGVPRLSFAP